MSEELNEIKKRPLRKKELTEKYQYVPEENEELIMDKPSEPLEIEADKNEVIVMKVKSERIIIKSNKELYESYIKELKKFSLSINGEIIYDSSIDKTIETPVKFENDYFILYGKKYSYNGLKIQKIN
jgi:hypothetical protein